jgi:hypothetical protein
MHGICGNPQRTANLALIFRVKLALLPEALGSGSATRTAETADAGQTLSLVAAVQRGRRPAARRAERAAADSAPLPRQHGQQRLQLDLRLGQLGGRLGVAHHAHPGVAVGDRAAQQRAAQRDG